MAKRELTVIGTGMDGKVSLTEAGNAPPFYIFDVDSKERIGGQYPTRDEAREALNRLLGSVFLVLLSRYNEEDLEDAKKKVATREAPSIEAALQDILLVELNAASLPPSRIVGVLAGGNGDTYNFLAEFERPYDDHRILCRELQLGYDTEITGEFEILLRNGALLKTAAREEPEPEIIFEPGQIWRMRCAEGEEAYIGICRELPTLGDTPQWLVIQTSEEGADYQCRHNEDLHSLVLYNYRLVATAQTLAGDALGQGRARIDNVWGEEYAPLHHFTLDGESDKTGHLTEESAREALGMALFVEEMKKLSK